MTSLTFADRAIELFQRRPAENAVDWLVNQLLALAAESRFLSLRIMPSIDGQSSVVECSDSEHIVTSEGPVRVFRTLLARFAKMAEEEGGFAFNPYGGQVHFDRSGAVGPVRVDVEIANTSRDQSVSMVKANELENAGS